MIFQVGAGKEEETHVDIGDPDQGKAGNQVAAPIWIEQLISGDK